jgi:hypothetical protein
MLDFCWRCISLDLVMVTDGWSFLVVVVVDSDELL